MGRFSDILSKRAEDIKAPPLPPRGTYVFVVNGLPKLVERKGFDVIDIPLKGVRPTDDVDMDAFREYGGSATGIIVRKSFLFNTDPTEEIAFQRTENDYKDFLQHHLGIPPGTLKEMAGQVLNKQCLGVLDYRPDKEDPERIYTDLKKTAPLD
jgi:hypothetical protein